MAQSKYFSFWKLAYDNKAVTEETLEVAVTKGKLTEDEFLSIVGS